MIDDKNKKCLSLIWCSRLTMEKTISELADEKKLWI